MTDINQPDSNESVLKQLRSLMPSRQLTFGEALQVAERQANRLLDLHHLSCPAVPIEIITEQPRIRVVQSYDLPASGSAHWDGQDWIITLNAAEYNLRQRYTVCHEYKHLLDHPVRMTTIRRSTGSRSDHDEAIEKIADYFAACVLMPKAWVKRAFYSGIQNVELLAANFHVSPKAMSYRLNELGLTTPVDRCTTARSRTTRLTSTPPRRAWTSRSPYRRQLSHSQLPPRQKVLT